MKKPTERGFIGNLVVRWAICSFGLWIAAGIFSSSVSLQNKLSALVIAGQGYVGDVDAQLDRLDGAVEAFAFDQAALRLRRAPFTDQQDRLP